MAKEPISVSQLREQYRNLRRLHMICAALAVLALILYFVEPWLTLAALALSLLINLFLVRTRSKAYTSEFIHLAALQTLQRHLEQAEHTHKPVLTEAQIRSARMLPCNAASGSVSLHEGGLGMFHGRKVVLGDVTLAHTFTEGSKKRHNFAVGCWATLDLEKDTGLDCRFIGANTTPEQSLKEMLWVESDLKQTGIPMALRSPWKVVCPEDNITMPGDRFLKQLEKLHQKTDGLLAVSVQGDQLHILLVGQILGQKVTSRMEPGPNFHQADLLPHLSAALELSDLL